MSNFTEKTDILRDKAFGGLSAIQTLLDRYPILTGNMDGLRFNISSDLLVYILYKLGVSTEDLKLWLSRLLTGDETESSTDKANGFLNVIENAFKAALMANFKKVFTCQMNPVIPNDLLDEYYAHEGDNDNYTLHKGKGIEIPVNSIDGFGFFKNCPVSKEGSFLYFDAKTPLVKNRGSAFTVNTLYQSMDFNAFLWYVINISGIDDKEKTMWDNRCRYITHFNREENNTHYNAFFKARSKKDEGSYYISDTIKLKKKEICYVNFIERDTDVISIKLNSKRYQRNVKGIRYVNKTLFEFNYDYIYSLKLFDSKVLCASILNAVFGLSNGEFNAFNYSIETKMAYATVSKIVGEILKNISAEKEITDCMFTFSNDEYEQMLKESVSRYGNSLSTFDSSTIDKIYSQLDEIDSSATLTEKQNSIYDTINNISAIAAKNGVGTVTDNFSNDVTNCFSLVSEFIHETITQVIMQLFTPKVALLFKINAEIMGDITKIDKDDAEHFSTIRNMIATFIQSNINMIIDIIKEIYTSIIEMLKEYVKNELNALKQKFMQVLASERIKAYRNLIEQLFALLKLFRQKNGGVDYAIDNVDYADIISELAAPNNDKCG